MAKKIRLRLTDAVAKRLPAPKQGNSRVSYDAELPGFGCCVTRNGARSWMLNYVTKAGRERRYTIGALQLWRATAARDEAKRPQAGVDSEGGDPLGELEHERGAATCPTVRAVRAGASAAQAPGGRCYRRLISSTSNPHLARLRWRGRVGADVDRLNRKITKADIRIRPTEWSLRQQDVCACGSLAHAGR